MLFFPLGNVLNVCSCFPQSIDFIHVLKKCVKSFKIIGIKESLFFNVTVEVDELFKKPIHFV